MRRRASLAVGLAVMALARGATAAERRALPTTAADLPEAALARMLDAIDLNRPGLERARDAASRGDLVGAGAELVAYYRSAAVAAERRGSAPAVPDSYVVDAVAAADAILADRFTFQGVTGTAPRQPDGGLDWGSFGPRGDREWGYFLNRHYIFLTLLEAYRRTGDERYARVCSDLVTDWILANPLPDAAAATAPWRVMEAGSRMLQTWAQAFYGFRDSEAFSPAARLLMLDSVNGHCAYIRQHHYRRHNHAIKELAGLIHATLAWPELKGAAGWYDYAAETLAGEIALQVYPDGVHKELSAHYHATVLTYLTDVARMHRTAGRAMPAPLGDRIGAMARYLALSLRPDGFAPHNNDGDLLDVQARVELLAEALGRPEWTWAATGGARGSAPVEGPSLLFPWAGQLIARSGWDREAGWAFFDAGPWGTATHQHDDMLHLSVYAHGRPLLVDAGRYHYADDVWRAHFRSSAAHNTVLVDEAGQNPGVEEATAPLSRAVSTAALAFARAAFTAGYRGVEGRAEHARALLYRGGDWWLVADRLVTDRPRRLTVLWHFHPDCTVGIDGTAVVSADQGVGNLRIEPLGGPPWRIELVRGREAPAIQGWWSPTYGERRPGTVAIFSAKVAGSTTFGWLLVGGAGPVARPAVVEGRGAGATLVARVGLTAGAAEEIAVRLNDTESLDVPGGQPADAELLVVRSGEPPVIVRCPDNACSVTAAAVDLRREPRE